MSKLNELTDITPTVDDYVPTLDASVPTTLQKTTWETIRTLFKTTYDTLYQAILVSGTNIKTVNSNSLLGSGDLSLPVLTDGDKGDIIISGTGTVMTIDNGVVSNAKLANVSTATFKGRTTAGTGSPEDLTATQATALLNPFASGLKGLVPSPGTPSGLILKDNATFDFGNRILVFDNTEVTSVSTTSFQTFGTCTIPAGFLNGRAVRIRMYCLIKSQNLADTRDDPAFKITYGGVDCAVLFLLNRGTTNERQGWVEAMIYGTGTSAQNSIVHGTFVQTGTAASTTPGTGGYATGTNTVNSASAQTLTIQGANGASNVAQYIKKESIIIELLGI